MKEKQKLIDLSLFYENYILSKYKNLEGFYWNGDCTDVIKDCFGKLDLEYCGSGACCSTYKDINYVIKFHTPYNEKMPLTCNPTQKILNLCRKYKEPCDKNNWYPPEVKYFLLYNFITK